MIDFGIVLLFLGLFFAGFRRGVALECVHLATFIATYGLGYFIFRDWLFFALQNPDELKRLFTFISLFFLMLYTCSLLFATYGLPFLLGVHETNHNTKELRFFGGFLGLTQGLVLLFGVQFWYALESPMANRFEKFPAYITSSHILMQSAAAVDVAHRQMAEKGWVKYEKITYQRPAPAAEPDHALRRLLGVE